MRESNLILRALALLVLVFFVMLSVVPYLWTLDNSLRPSPDIGKGFFILHEIELSHWITFITRGHCFEAVRNSIVVATLTTIIAVFLGLITSYSLVKLKIKYKREIFGTILGAQFIPMATLLVPFYILLYWLGLLDTWWGLTMIYLVFTLPLAAWLLAGFLLRFPWELLDAALIDGCSRLYALFKILIPVLRPGMFSTAILVFIKVWQEYLAAEVLTDTYKAATLPVFVNSLQGQISIHIGAIMAGAIFLSLPILVMFLIFNKQFFRGLYG